MTIRATLDSNILIYAAMEPQTDKGKRAAPTTTLVAQATLKLVEGH